MPFAPYKVDTLDLSGNKFYAHELIELFQKIDKETTITKISTPVEFRTKIKDLSRNHIIDGNDFDKLIQEIKKDSNFFAIDKIIISAEQLSSEMRAKLTNDSLGLKWTIKY